MKINYKDEISYLKSVFGKVGFSKENSQLLSKTLTDADLRGISSHGIQRLKWYLSLVKEETIKPKNKFKIIKESQNSLLIDANGNMGQIACDNAMNKLIDKAKKFTISMAVIKNSNHFGTAGYWSRKASQKGLIGISMTNTRPLVVPINAFDAFLGSNAFSFTFPAKPHPFVFDGATSVVAGGKIQVHDKKGEQLPGEWVVDKNRNVVKDPKEAEESLYNAALTEKQKGGGLLTLGGISENNSNYKGFGNSIIVELLTGILAQGSISADTNKGKHDFSQFLMVIDPSFFGNLDVLSNNASDMFNRLRRLKHLSGKKIIVPGDREYKFYDDNLKNGVSIDNVTLKQMEDISKTFNVNMPDIFS
ncbi:Ldh family oxidoreductase [Apilactobacillus timberlakei]|uniref:Ldh family oxidoreductase n=1 Tax=Apilactobacillus timberlakei TaxID=2008380 RepID=A0ABY2YSZ8_9LACO|nr:Ldh family oxidoreductase [Apilactobacillus timberlakei]TPR13156.1 Ldh family oxidoreductase [Apilactobacillus timberlakei]TPR14206.1 Ldh family oxidoreductase [Apilactobacillus timberlakei]TPR16459.1 Ldh family oxidoreductase [Apilactobacillus timberlakei]TPR20477.1 Ldh family oxidoreductase [Apilactobacillus timberlakei]TPR22521.1 Ldh family oxidoreductase [Apilactobacillus timberlakei]